MNTLKVLILITKANWGGAQRHVYDLATRLPKEVFHVKVMAGFDGPLTEKLSAAGINAFGTLDLGRDVDFPHDVRACFRLIKLLRKDKPDILHLHSSKVGCLGAIAGRVAGVKRIIFTAHGWAFNEDRPIFQKIPIALLHWITVMFCHETIAISEATAKQVRRFPFIDGKITIVKNGLERSAGFSRVNARLELTRMNPALKEAVASVSDANLVWIGTIGELHVTKGYDYAIEAVERCVRSFEANHSTKKIIYTIVSTGEERERLETKVKNLKLEKNIIFMGYVAKAAEYLKAFDIFLMSSISEGLPYVVLEAGMASVPIVATSVGGIPEVIDDMETGIMVEPKSARELAHAISYTIEHPVERRAYGAKLREKILKEFSLEWMIAGVTDVYLRKPTVATEIHS